MLPIQKKLINFNFNKDTNSPKYIVIHDTGNNDKQANAQAHYKYFNGGNRNSSAHVFVDDNNIIQTVEFKDSSWHVGDGKGKNGITNQNSIGIEICVNLDGNYDKAVENTIELVKYLMNELNIDLDHVIRHYDASGKNCPTSMSSNNWTKWNEFKSQLIDKPKKYYIITDYLPQGAFGIELNIMLKHYFLGVDRVYLRHTEKGVWIETQYLDFNKCLELKTKLEKDKLFYEIKEE